MSKDKILRNVTNLPVSIDSLVDKTRIPRTTVCRYVKALIDEGKILSLPTTPITYIQVSSGKRSEMYQELMEMALPRLPSAMYKMEGLWLEWILSGTRDEEALSKVNHFLNMLIGTLVNLQDGFKANRPSELPATELFNRYRERKLKEHDAK